jgi:predicted O-methyltransferase YrrM
VKPVKTRVELADLCSRRKFARAVEVGTDHGVFAAEFLPRWTTKGHLWCIDHYERCAHTPFDRTADLVMACVILAPYADHCRIVHGRSLDIAKSCGMKWSPEFVYLDADHEYESVRDDIAAWWPCITPGGILAGHDYIAAYLPGVVKAVDEFAAANDFHIRLTQEPVPSWWVVKP